MLKTTAFAFERKSNILSFSRNSLPIKNNPTHLYIPWTGEFDGELLFKVKGTLATHGRSFIPFVDLNMNAVNFEETTLKKIESQLKENIETHLIMSNGESIHILKVSGVNSQINKKSKGIVDSFKNLKGDYFWIEVEDLYVYKANHSGEMSISDELQLLIEVDQKGHYFTPLQKINVESNIDEEATNWIKSQRNLTYDYFVRSCELEQNIFQDSWKELNASSRHCLISFEQLRHKALLHKDKEKFSFLKESFELYLSGILNELNAVYISPLAHTFGKYDCLQEAWGDVKDGLINSELRVILEETYKRDDKQLTSLEDFIFYVDTIKSCFFSLKNKFSRKIGKEEFLIVETFLTKQEGMIESLISREVDQKISSLIKVKNWLNQYSDIDSIDDLEINQVSLKLTHLLSILGSTNYEDNIFFKVLEEKTAKGFVKRSFEDEVNLLTVKECRSPVSRRA
jgi:hypothetical protein